MSGQNSIEVIKDTMGGWQKDIAAVLPSDMDIDAFMKSATSALINNPKVFVECSHDSLLRALIKAANDGLRPDGKEGALVPYFNRDAEWIDEKGEEKKGLLEAQWMPMVFGIRKKAKDKDGIIITAEVVYKNDQFLVVKGDDDRIEHLPADMDKDAGPVIASYAIFKQGDIVLHREVMRLQDIKNVQNASKSPNSPAWKNWFGEMAKKAAVNRGSKSVPMSDSVRQVIDRDNDFYDLQAVRDAPAERGAVSLDRFSGNRRSEGFAAGNIGRQLTDQSGQGMPMDTGKQGQKDTVQQGRAENNQTGKKEQAKEIDGSANYPTLPRKTVEDYAAALQRYATSENVQKGHEEYWKENGGKPNEVADVNLTRFILDRNCKRADGKMEMPEAKAEIAEEIAKAYKL